MNKLKLALVQMTGAAIGEYSATAARLEDLLQQACRQGADLVLFPECAYPAYLIGHDGAERTAALAHAVEVIRRVAVLARENRVYVVLGIAVPRDGQLFNAALVFDREGREIAYGAKSNLWHFDAAWFTSGPPADVFDTEFGRMGLMVCADGRMPELAALLRQKGARLILDPVNLVAAAPAPAQFNNPQYAFMLQARARENGVFIAACDKCGVEADIVTFLGRSFVVDPAGKIIAEASPDREEILTCTIDLDDSRPVRPRRPELFRALARPVVSPTPVQTLLDTLAIYTLVVRFPYSDTDDYIAQATRFIRNGAILGARLVVLPELRQPRVLDDTCARRFADALAPDQLLVLAGSVPAANGAAAADAGGGLDGSPGSFAKMAAAADADGRLGPAAGPLWRRRALVLNREGCLGEIDATHVPDSLPGAEISVVALTPDIRLAALFDIEVEIPEIARTAMLKGADLLVCFDDGSDDERLRLMQTRAAENRIFVIRSVSRPDAASSLILSPDAAVVTTTLAAPRHAAAGLVNTALSKLKDVVPGTNIVTGRHPEWYRDLTE